jgi:predicted nuclease with TOPRIM domain
MDFNLSIADFINSGLAALVGYIVLEILKRLIASYTLQFDGKFTTIKAQLKESETRDKALDISTEHIKKSNEKQTLEIEKIKAIIESLRFQNDVLNEKIDSLSDDFKELRINVRLAHQEDLGKVIVRE